MSDSPGCRVVDALKEERDLSAARKPALEAAINYARSRLRSRAGLRGAALRGVVDRIRPRLRKVIRRVFRGRLSVQAAAYVLECATVAIVIEYRRGAKHSKRSRGRPLTGRGLMVRSHIVLLDLDPQARIALIADVRSYLFDDATSEREPLDAIRNEIDAYERRRAQKKRKSGEDFGVAFTAAIRVPRDGN